MAQRVTHRIVGVEDSKTILDVLEREANQAYSIANESQVIDE